jgi:hypothetical protein
MRAFNSVIERVPVGGFADTSPIIGADGTGVEPSAPCAVCLGSFLRVSRCRSVVSSSGPGGLDPSLQQCVRARQLAGVGQGDPEVEAELAPGGIVVALEQHARPAWRARPRMAYGSRDGR